MREREGSLQNKELEADIKYKIVSQLLCTIDKDNRKRRKTMLLFLVTNIIRK